MSKRNERKTEPNYARDRRRQLRTASTDPEQLLWSVLRDRQAAGQKFRRQHSIGPYLVDFVCLEKKLIIEVDGDYHDHVIESDLVRQRYLESSGYVVMRFSNDEVMSDLEAVYIAVERALNVGRMV